jgi:hypothetical protein
MLRFLVVALREAARELAEKSARYAHSPVGYGEEIDALTATCREVQATPWKEERGDTTREARRFNS